MFPPRIKYKYIINKNIKKCSENKKSFVLIFRKLREEIFTHEKRHVLQGFLQHCFEGLND